MNNIEKLQHVGILGEVRKRLGAGDENDTSEDDSINRMTNTKLIEHWCAWEIGDGGWWRGMKSNFDTLEQLDKIQP